MSTDQIGIMDQTPRVVNLPPVTTPLLGMAQACQALSLLLGHSPTNTASLRGAMGDVPIPNQPDLSRLGTQTSISLNRPTFRLSESLGRLQGNPSPVAWLAPFPGHRPGLGVPSSSIPQPSRFVGSGQDTGPLRAGRPVPLLTCPSAVEPPEFTPLLSQGEGTGLLASGSRSDRFRLPRPLTTCVTASPAILQSYAPLHSVTTDMGTHARVGYPCRCCPSNGVPGDTTPRGRLFFGQPSFTS